MSQHLTDHSKASPSTRSLLVVDDEPTSVEETVNQLRDRGFDVRQAQTQTQAAQELGNRAFDAVLLDLMLPRNQIAEPKVDPPLAENSLALLKRLREDEFKSNGTSGNVPVFAISALGQEAIEVLEKVRSLGCQDVFGKPVKPIFVAETMRMYFEEPL